MNPISNERCAICLTTPPHGKLILCGGCRSVSFCSKECVVVARKTHTSECARIAKETLESTVVVMTKRYVIQEPNPALALELYRERLEKELHPLLCLEFACFLGKEPSLLAEACAYRELGLLLVQADTLCMENHELITVHAFLNYQCKLPGNVESKKIVIKEELLGSPLWILEYTHCCPKKCVPKPKEEWNEIRLNYLKKK